MPREYIRGPAQQRFWPKVTKTETCWVWHAATTIAGYGNFWDGRRYAMAHRLSWEWSNGPIPDGQWVLHRCDNPPCVRPDHLFLGNNTANMADMRAKGRSAAGDRNGMRKHPERVARGLRSRAYTSPETMPRGEQHPNAKLTVAKVVAIRGLHAEGVSQHEIARRFGISPMTVSGIVLRKQWKHVD